MLSLWILQVQNDLKEIRDELANLSSNNTSSTTIDPAVMERLQSAPSSGASDNAAGLSCKNSSLTFRCNYWYFYNYSSIINR